MTKTKKSLKIIISALLMFVLTIVCLGLTACEEQYDTSATIESVDKATAVYMMSLAKDSILNATTFKMTTKYNGDDAGYGYVSNTKEYFYTSEEGDGFYKLWILVDTENNLYKRYYDGETASKKEYELKITNLKYEWLSYIGYKYTEDELDQYQQTVYSDYTAFTEDGINTVVKCGDTYIITMISLETYNTEEYVQYRQYTITDGKIVRLDHTEYGYTNGELTDTETFVHTFEYFDTDVVPVVPTDITWSETSD